MTAAQFKSHAGSISAGYSRSSVASQPQMYAPSSDATETETSFGLDDVTFKQIETLFKQLRDHNTAINLIDPKKRRWLFRLNNRVAMTPDERRLPHAGWKFEVKVEEPGPNGALKSSISAGYSLVPRFIEPTDRLNPFKRRKLRWFLNVSCNPTKVLLPEGPEYQLTGVLHPRKPGKRLRGHMGLIVLNTVGYWFLENMGDALHAANPGIAPFRWDSANVKKLTTGQPQLIEVSYSMLSARVSRISVHELFTTVYMTYYQNLYYTDRVTREVNLGKMLNILVERVTPSKENAHGGPRTKGAAAGTDTSPIRLTKFYSDGSIKSRLEFDFYLPRAKPNQTGGAALKTTFTMHSSFFRKILRAEGVPLDDHRPITVADLVRIGLRGATPASQENAFARYFGFVSAEMDDAMANDYALNDLVCFRPIDFYQRVADWIGKDEQRQLFIENWTSLDPEAPSGDMDLSSQTGIPLRTVQRYRASLKSVGLSMRIPYAYISMLADIRIAAGMTLGDRTLWMQAMNQLRCRDPAAWPKFQEILTRAIVNGEKSFERLLSCAPVHDPSLLNARPLPQVLPATDRFARLVGGTHARKR